MTLIRVSGPDNLVSLELAKAQLRVDHNDDDLLIQLYIDAATSRLDGPLGILGKAFGRQTWRQVLGSFPSVEFTIPVEPLREVSYIKYTNKDGDETIIDTDNYVIRDSLVFPSYGFNWPVDYTVDSDAVAIEWTAGEEAVNSQVQHAALLLVGHMYRNRESTTGEIMMKEIPQGIYDLVSNVRKRGV